VAGIFDRPPGEDGAALLRRIAVGPSGEVVDLPQMRTAAHDVTGGVPAERSAHAALHAFPSLTAAALLVCRLRRS